MAEGKYGKLCKEKMIGEISSMIKDKPNFVVTDYMGSSVAELEQVRKNLRTASSEYIVVKNSILRVICDQNKIDGIKPLIDGGIGISFSGSDIVATCKVLVNFSKDHQRFKIKAAYVDGKLMTVNDVKALASLPSRQALLGQVVTGMKSPITGFVYTLSGILKKFLYVVNAIKDSKHSSSLSASAESK